MAENNDYLSTAKQAFSKLTGNHSLLCDLLNARVLKFDSYTNNSSLATKKAGICQQMEDKQPCTSSQGEPEWLDNLLQELHDLQPESQPKVAGHVAYKDRTQQANSNDKQTGALIALDETLPLGGLSYAHLQVMSCKASHLPMCLIMLTSVSKTIVLNTLLSYHVKSLILLLGKSCNACLQLI